MLKKRYATQYYSAPRAQWVREDFYSAELVAIIANYIALPDTWVEVAMITERPDYYGEHLRGERLKP